MMDENAHCPPALPIVFLDWRAMTLAPEKEDPQFPCTQKYRDEVEPHDAPEKVRRPRGTPLAPAPPVDFTLTATRRGVLHTVMDSALGGGAAHSLGPACIQVVLHLPCQCSVSEGKHLLTFTVP